MVSWNKERFLQEFQSSESEFEHNKSPSLYAAVCCSNTHGEVARGPSVTEVVL